MRILFVTSAYPENIETATVGIYKRMRMFLEALNGIAELEILFYVGSRVPVAPERAGRMERLLQEHWGCPTRITLSSRSGKTTVEVPPDFPLGEWLKDLWFVHPYYYGIDGEHHLKALDDCLDRKPDAIFVHRLNSVVPVLASRKVTQPVYFDLDDVEHRAFARNLKQPPFWRSKFLQHLKLPSLLLLERRSINLARKTFVCSETDRHYLAQRLRLPRVATIPNAVEMPKLHDSPESPSFLFIGTYKYLPNAAAANHLIRRIWPAIRRELPGSKLVIAGECPENIDCFRERHDGVEFRGYVDDLDQLYRETRVVCCPILSGSGTRVKIIEAAAHGKAVVSTSLGAEGLDFVDGHEILLRDDGDSFARSCVDLARDKALSDRLGRAARARAEQLYSREHVIDRIRREISTVL